MCDRSVVLFFCLRSLQGSKVFAAPRPASFHTLRTVFYDSYLEVELPQYVVFVTAYAAAPTFSWFGRKLVVHFCVVHTDIFCAPPLWCV